MVTEVIKTEEQLLTELRAAVDKGEFKEVAKLSTEVVKLQTKKEKDALEAKKQALESTTTKVKTTIDKVVQKLVDSKELDIADGVWYAYDFGDTSSTCRLMKSVPKPTKAGGGGGGKKFAISTEEMLTKHGSTVVPENGLTPKYASLRGMTYQAACDSDPSDGNLRYAVRLDLLKLEGLA